MSVMFEAFTQRPRVDRARWLGLSALAHALLVLVAWRAMVASQAPTSAEPPRVTFFAPPPPPPPPGGGKRETPRVKKQIPRRVLPAKVPQPQEPQPAEDRPDEGGQIGGVVGGVRGGVVGGVVGARAEFDSRMTPPKLLSGPAIEYTDKALENDVEGLMIVRCVLDIAGEVKNCEVKQGLRFMDNAVVETLHKRRYTPVTLEGRPIEVYYTFRVRLTLPR